MLWPMRKKRGLNTLKTDMRWCFISFCLVRASANGEPESCPLLILLPQSNIYSYHDKLCQYEKKTSGTVRINLSASPKLIMGRNFFFKERVRQLSHFNWLEYKPFCLGLNSQIGLRQNEDSVIRSPQISYYKQWYRCNRSPAIPPTLCLHRFWNLCYFFFCLGKGSRLQNIYIYVYIKQG